MFTHGLNVQKFYISHTRFLFAYDNLHFMKLSDSDVLKNKTKTNKKTTTKQNPKTTIFLFSGRCVFVVFRGFFKLPL